MAYIAPRKNADGDITSYQVKCRLGGARSGPWQIERFDEEDPAVVFRDAVTAAGQQWPPGWVKGQGYRAIRAWCRRHGIAVTIPERSDQVANRLLGAPEAVAHPPSTQKRTSTATSLRGASTGSSSSAR